MRNEIEGRGKTFGNVGKRGKQIMIREKEKKRRFAGKYRGYAFPTTNKMILPLHFLSYISLPLQSFSVFLQAIN